MIIGDNYGETDTETGERFGMGGQNGDVCSHKWIKSGDGGSAYQECSYCGEKESLVEK